MAVLQGGAPLNPKNTETYEEILFVLRDQLGLMKKSGLSWKSQSGQKFKIEQRWYPLGEYRDHLAGLVNGADLDGLAGLPRLKVDQTGLYLEIKWAKDNSVVAIQVVEPRPREGGRYAIMTPAVVFTDADGAAAAAALSL